MKIKRVLQTAALGGALVSATANAQLEIPRGQYWDTKPVDGFQTVIAFPMLWAPEISLDIDTDGGTTEVVIPFKDIVERLNVGLMGELYVNWKWLGLIAKGMYMDVSTKDAGADFSYDTGAIGTIEGNLDADVNLKMGMYDLGLSFRLWRNLRLFTVARLTQVDVSVKLDGNVGIDYPGLPAGCDPNAGIIGGCVVPPFKDSSAINEKIDVTPDDAWDYQVGLQYAWWLGNTKRHGINLYGDIQAWGDSDQAWQLDLRYMYRVSEMNNFWLGWRTYVSEMEPDDQGHQTVVTLNGPLAGWAFSF